MPELHASIRSQLVREAASLRSLARYLVRGDDAEDIAQDTVVTALSQNGSAQPTSLRPWLRQVLRNRVRVVVRRDRRRRDRERVATVPDSTTSIDDDVERAELVSAVWQALDDLEEPYRNVLRQRFLQERSPSQIARDEGTAATTVRWRVHEGLRRMRRKLDERFEDRRTWCGGLAAVFGWPAATPTATEPLSMMTKTILLSTLAMAAVVATTIAVAGSSEPDTVQPGPRMQPMLSAMSTAAPTSAGESTALSYGDRAEPDENEADDPAASPEAAFAEAFGQERHGPTVGDALKDCSHLVEGKKIERLEIDINLIGGPPEVGPMFEDVVVTSGRKVPCADPVDELQPITDQSFEVLQELSECLRESLDPRDFKADLAEGERARMTQYMMAEEDTGPDLPEVEAPEFDPVQAIAALDLPRLGSEGALPIIECGDYDCPFCKRSEDVVTQLLEDYEGAVAVHWLHNPMKMHKTAVLKARAAHAAGQQGAFWEMHRAIFSNPSLVTEDALVAEATTLGLDADRFRADLVSDTTATAIATQQKICTQAGARGTPSFFIGDDMLTGARPVEEFAPIIDEALAD